MTATDVLEDLLASRYSCRGFKPDPVPRATIERILALAQRTASWCNSQPWQLAIASGAAAERFRQGMVEQATSAAPHPDFAYPAAYRGIYLDRRQACGLQLYKSVGVQKGDRDAADRQRLENFRFFGAPHVAIITTEADLGIYGAVDCGAYVTNFMLAAHSLGVASIAQAALATYPDYIRDFFGLGPERKVVCGLSFGYPDPDHPANGFRTDRAAVDDAVTWFED